MKSAQGWYIVFSWMGRTVLCRQHRSVSHRNRVELAVAKVLVPGTYWVWGETLEDAQAHMEAIMQKLHHREDCNASANKEEKRIDQDR